MWELIDEKRWASHSIGKYRAAYILIDIAVHLEDQVVKGLRLLALPYINGRTSIVYT